MFAPRSLPIFLVGSSLWLLCAARCSHADDYLETVKPLLQAKCVSCHGGLKQSGGLRLDTAQLAHQGGDTGSAIVAGDPERSLLWQRVTASDSDERMPPDAEPLTAGELAQIKAWIRAGGQAPKQEVPQSDPRDHWAFQPLNQAAAPSGNGLQPIDAFIADRLERVGLSLAPQADNRTLVLRLFRDITGLTPDWENLQAWTQRLEADHNAIDELIDRLLASPRHGEQFAQQWLDVVRYADTHGFEVNTPRPNAWPYRDYIIEAINADKPYNRFAAEQIAGDQFSKEAATGFMVAAAVLLPGQIGQDDASKRLARQDALDEVIVGTSATFLGLTIGCARCHDHKFDPISQRDYYALQAFFAGIEYGDRELRDASSHQREAELASLTPRLAALKRELENYQPRATVDRWLMIDDQDEQRVTHLQKARGHGENPPGVKRGYRDDVGTARRSANVSRGRYTWWTNAPGIDTFTWDPASPGRFRMWLSWGVHGSGVHTRDARYVLDRDGDLQTTNDQSEIARADQYYPASVKEGETEHQPTWSGFLNAGVHELGSKSRLILRGGDSGTGITADVLLLERVESEGSDTNEQEPSQAQSQCPQLRGPVSPLENVERFEPRLAKFVRFTSLETVDRDKHEPCLDELEIYAGGQSTENLAAGSQVKVSSSGDFPPSERHKLQHINDGQYGNGRSWISNERGSGWVQLELPAPQLVDTVVWGRDRQGKLKDRLPVRYRVELSVDGQNWRSVACESDRAPYDSPHDDRQVLLRQLNARQAPASPAPASPAPASPARAVAAESNAEQVALRGAGVEASGERIDSKLENKLKQLDRLRKRQLELETPAMVYAAVSRQCDRTHLLNRGDPEQPQEQVAPGLPAIISGLTLAPETDDLQRRRALADWFDEPSSAIVARVIVNRVWQNHFGIGLVETPSDFGLSGARPSHPELLEWLAAQLVAHEWSLKWLERSILRSQTYQQSSRIDPVALAQDADDRLLWRFPAHRLAAEAIRDNVLRVSGSLNLEMGGPGFDFFKVRGGLSGFPPVEKFSGQEMRRMIYAHKIRMERVPVFGAFDCPDAGQASPRRSQSTTPIQALNLFNSDFIADQAELFAQRVRSELKLSAAQDHESIERHVQQAFALAFGRLPENDELSAGAEIVGQHGLPVLCRVLLNSNEFLTLP